MCIDSSFPTWDLFGCNYWVFSGRPLQLIFIFWFQLNDIILNPSEGLFWQVDHIKPVYSGGGQCSIENLQTLCTVCHKEVSTEHGNTILIGPTTSSFCFGLLCQSIIHISWIFQINFQMVTSEWLLFVHLIAKHCLTSILIQIVSFKIHYC